MANAGSSTSPSFFSLTSFSVAPKSKPLSSGSFYPTFSRPPPLPNITELAVESLAFTLPDLHALSSVSQQYHRRSHRRGAREKKVPRPCTSNGALFDILPPLPLRLFAGIRPSLAVESTDVRPQVVLHASSRTSRRVFVDHAATIAERAGRREERQMCERTSAYSSSHQRFPTSTVPPHSLTPGTLHFTDIVRPPCAARVIFLPLLLRLSFLAAALPGVPWCW
ncbi:hypothetical protein B0H13DRAFT_2423086, partial [Mycena leptocephala]